MLKLSEDRPPLNLLVAYPYVNKAVLSLVRERQKEIRLLVDSGAFTAWKAKKEIKLDDYCRFIETLPVKPWRYFTLDVVGNPKETMVNYNLMLKRGFKPIPIFTRGEDSSVLDEYYKTSDVVGVGGLVKTKGKNGFVKGIMSKIGSRKVHWLGFINLAFLKYFKPYMCDSSTWSMGSRYGSFPFYPGHGLNPTQITRKTLSKQSKDLRFLARLDEYKINLKQLFDNSNWSGPNSLPNYLAARSMRDFSDDVYKNLSTFLFLACSGSSDIKLLLGDK